jgi:hypothetical protein
MTEIAMILDLAVGLLQSVTPVLQIIQQANAEGRTTLTPDEWTTIKSAADAAHAKVAGLIGTTPPAP